MALNMSSAMDVHKYYGGSGSFADRRKTWQDLGLGDAASYQGTAVQNARLVSAMNDYNGLTRPAQSAPVATPVTSTSPSPVTQPAASSSSPQATVTELRSRSDALRQQLAALAPYDNSQLMNITKNYANQRGALGAYDDSAAQNIYQAYMNQRNAMGPFQYNYATDPVYQAYAAQYQRDGRRAMEDTLAQVAARTGGLASSYAGAAAQQQYDRYMAELNNVIPQLEQIAYGRYRDARGDLDADLKAQLALEGLAYDRYRNRLGDLDSDYKTQLALEEVFYNRDRDLRSDMAKDLSTARSLEQTEYKNLADLIENSGYQPTAEELYAAGMTTERANALRQTYLLAQQAAQQAAAAKAAKSSSGSGSSSSKKTAMKDKWTVLDEVSKMKGNDTAKQDKLADYYNQGVLTETEVAEIAGYLDLVEEAAVVLTDEERFLKNSPAQFLQKFGVSRFREVYGARADDYLKKLQK